MQIDIATAGFLLAALMTALMGFAIQRGATCSVAAMDEIVGQRRCVRLASMLEASLWVAAGLLLAALLGWSAFMPRGYAIGWGTCVGAVLLGLGAFVNRACVVGTVARLGAGEWSYLATPLGYFLGCAALHALPMAPHPVKTDALSPVLAGAAWSAPLLACLVLWRIAHACWRWRAARASPFAWLSAPRARRLSRGSARRRGRRARPHSSSASRSCRCCCWWAIAGPIQTCWRNWRAAPR